MHYLRVIIHDVPLDYLVISDDSFLNAQLTMSNYEIRARKDRDKYGGGLIEFVRKGGSNLLRSNHLKQKLDHL